MFKSCNATPTASVAIVGAGPSGFYAAEALLKQGVEVAIIERLPAPFGLVRYGVAPDHPKLKTTTHVFERIASSDGCHFFGNIEVGLDIQVAQITALFDAVILAHGARDDKRLDITGEDVPGCHGAAEFVGWYNGHPDFRNCQFDLSQESAIVIGNGNVALDIARILAKSPDALATTDISDHALQQLRLSRVKDIHIVGRRGPDHAKFSITELRELERLQACSITCDGASGSPVALSASGTGPSIATAADWFNTRLRGLTSNEKRIHFHFFKAPLQAAGTDRLESVEFSRTLLAPDGRSVATGDTHQIKAGLMFRAIGYRGVALPGVPFDTKVGVIPTYEHRVTDTGGTVVPKLYATGWIKRGPSGIIGTNRADSVAVVQRVTQDLSTREATWTPGAAGLRAYLYQHGHQFVDIHQWRRIDKAEIDAGARVSKPREKFTKIIELLKAGAHQTQGA